MRRIRVLKRLLKKKREAKKLDKHLWVFVVFWLVLNFHSFFFNFRNREIHKRKAEVKRSKMLSDQAEARRQRNKDARTRREFIKSFRCWRS